MSADTEARLRSLMAVIFKTSIPQQGDVTREQTPAWDSLKNIELIFAVEDEFRVVFSEDDAATLNSLSALVRFIDAQHAA